MKMTSNQAPMTKQKKEKRAITVCILQFDNWLLFLLFGYWDLIIGIYLFVSCNLIIGYSLLRSV